MPFLSTVFFFSFHKEQALLFVSVIWFCLAWTCSEWNSMENPPLKEFLLKEDASLCLEHSGVWITMDLVCIYGKAHGAEEKQ